MKRASALVVAAALAVATAARAQDVPDAGVRSLQDGDRALQAQRVTEGERAEAECRIEDATRAWREAADAAPGTRLARRALGRLDALEARVAGGTAPMRALCVHRRDAMRIDRAGWLAYARELDAAPAGLVRREGRAVAAEALGRIGADDDARRQWAALLREPQLTETERRRAVEETARLDERAGRLTEAVRSLRDAGLGGSASVARIERERQRRVGRLVAWALVAAFLVVAGAVVGKRGSLAAVRRAVTPSRLAFAAWALLGPLLLATLYDHEAVDTFATLAASGAALLFVAALVGAAAPRGPRTRVLLASSSALAVLAAGYLVLDRAGFLLDLGM